MVTRLILACLLLALASVCRAARDAQSVADPRGSDRLSKRGAFWNYATSWQRKYRNGDHRQGPAFPGATTCLVWLTDAWHMLQFLSTCGIVGAVLVLAWPTFGWWSLCLPVAYAVVFEPVFKRLRKM